MNLIVPPLKQQLIELIQTPSISCNDPSIDQSNQAVVTKLAGWLEDLGFRVEQLPVPGHPGKTNLLASLGSGPGGLVLAGHTDTVPFDDSGWNQDPFTLTENQNRFYGLGTTDMKGFFPLAIEAAKAFVGQNLKQPLMILATADEETSMSGARALVAMKKPQARYAIIGEPTGLRPIRLHKGITMERIRVHGQSGHSSDPSLGANAMEVMHAIISELMLWRTELQQKYQHPGFSIQHPTLNLGCIHGGDSANRICGHCELDIDLRLIPGMQLDQLRQELRQRVNRVALVESQKQTQPIKVECEALFEGIPAFETPASNALVQMAEQLTGYGASSVAFGTEAPFLQELGTDTIILGPGDIDLAHQPNEYLALDSIQPCVEILKNFIRRICLENAVAA
ncbi:MAG: acetylornithine deacetylase [Moraxellaceae bacterium]|nr:MAG: acetylornithine deacetylase [Moraxellaceae bacterium]